MWYRSRTDTAYTQLAIASVPRPLSLRDREAAFRMCCRRCPFPCPCPASAPGQDLVVADQVEASDAVFILWPLGRRRPQTLWWQLLCGGKRRSGTCSSRRRRLSLEVKLLIVGHIGDGQYLKLRYETCLPQLQHICLDRAPCHAIPCVSDLNPMAIIELIAGPTTKAVREIMVAILPVKN